MFSEPWGEPQRNTEWRRWAALRGEGRRLWMVLRQGTDIRRQLGGSSAASHLLAEF